MIFNLKSNEKYYSPFIYPNGIYTLYHSYNNAINVFESADYFENKINDLNYWTEDIDEFIKDFLINKLKDYKIKPVISDELDFEFVIELNNETLCLRDKTIFSLDKKIALYFNEKINLTSNKDEFISLMKTRGILDYTYNDVIDKLKQYFHSDYKYYIPVLYDILKFQPNIYEKKCFEELIFVKSYLEKTKIYNIKSDFYLKKDSTGRYYQCEEYTESLTGRLFPQGESLQTLSKEKRNVLEADKDCLLLEFDFSAFEFNILLDILKIEKSKDPHTDILNHLQIKADRSVGKSINYSYLYGMTAERVVQVIKEEHDIDIDIELLKNYVLFEKKYDVKCHNGIINTFFDRPIKIEKDYALLNNFVQGTAVDIFVKKIKSIINILPKNNYNNRLLLQNHDSILIQLHEDVINNTDIVEDILKILKSPISLFTFEVEFKYGKTWSELS